MIRMNWRPPRAIAASSAARLPAAKARMRKRSRWNIGSSTRASITQKPASSARPPRRHESTRGDVQPIVCAPYGWIPYVIPTMSSTSPAAKVRFPHQSIFPGLRRPISRSERDEQNGEHDEEAEEQPEEVARVARLQRVDADAAEDVRQRDQQDRAVDHRHQRPERGVRERHPLVVRLPRADPQRSASFRKLDVYVRLAELDEPRGRVVDLQRRVLQAEAVAQERLELTADAVAVG